MTSRSRIRIVHRATTDEFHGRYKGHEISVEADHAHGGFYCQVRHPTGGYLCDGWLGTDARTTMDEAIELALVGACLIKEAA